MSKVIDGCGISGIISTKKNLIPGSEIVTSIDSMNFRYNGLGGGFAGYGIYPDYKDYYAFHMNFENQEAKNKAENFFYESLSVIDDEEIPIRKSELIDDTKSISWRYFVGPPKDMENIDDYIVKVVMHVNENIPGAHVFSSGKNMGVFKAVGYPKAVADYFRIEDYSAYIWTAHGRYPTNTPGWWGGAHPFNILDWSVVHNGELSSYGTNKNFLEMWGYKCTLLTDTEVLAYLFDLLVRRHKIPVELACNVLTPKFWSELKTDDSLKGKALKALRMTYGGAIVNGPFSIIVATNNFMFGLTDRVKLRPLIAARKDDRLYLASEECAIRSVCENPDLVWAPRGGEQVIAYIQEVT
ncbi:MAG: glutamine amidotransferase family protein [Candidatus Freyarchaeum deiterrae]